MDKRWFYDKASPFFENGLMYEIYSSDFLCICNVANQSYAVFNYMVDKNGVCGMLINTEFVEKIIDDNSFVAQMIASDKKKCMSRSFFLNDDTFRIFKKYKAINDVKGPTKSIDFEMEERIMKKNGLKR